MKKLLLILACFVVGCAGAKEDPLYWPCKLQSSVETNETWGIRQVKIHHLCFNNELENTVDVSSQSILSVIEHDERFNNRPVFLDVIQGKGARLKLHSLNKNNYLILSYSSGTNSNSLRLYKFERDVILESVGEIYSDNGDVIIDGNNASLKFYTKELDKSDTLKLKVYQLEADAILNVN